MNETILKQKQQMLDDALKLIDEQMAVFAGLNGPERAIEAEHWFRREITKALAPLIARIVQLEQKPMPTATAFKPSKDWEKPLLRARNQAVRTPPRNA
jgi:hypothetical protein